MKIYTPVKDFNGVRNTVRFVNGVGETNDPSLIARFKAQGYVVEDGSKRVATVSNDQITKIVDEVATIKSETTDNGEPNFDDMTPNDLRDWMRANGLGGHLKNIRNKEKLLEIIKQYRG